MTQILMPSILKIINAMLNSKVLYIYIYILLIFATISHIILYLGISLYQSFFEVVLKKLVHDILIQWSNNDADLNLCCSVTYGRLTPAKDFSKGSTWLWAWHAVMTSFCTEFFSCLSFKPLWKGRKFGHKQKRVIKGETLKENKLT